MNLTQMATYSAMRLLRRFDKKDQAVFEPGSTDHPDNTLFGRLIRTYAPGHSFADICCMWSMHGAVAFHAEESGATRVTAFDGMDPTPEFTNERQKRGSKVRFVQGNVDARNLADAVGHHDVIWCTGLLYHTPDPFRIVGDLLSIADRYAIIGSKTLPEIPGLPQAAIFLPGLSPTQRRAILPFWGDAVSRPFGTFPAWDYEWWWALSGSALAAMITTHPGWEIVSIHHRVRSGRNDNCIVVARKRTGIETNGAGR